MAGEGLARVFGAFAVFALTAGCRLEAKTGCRLNADCVAPRTCEKGVCVDPPPSDASVVDSPVDDLGEGGPGAPFTLCAPISLETRCRPTSAGRPMTCYLASALGGQDFCAPACDPNVPVDDPAHTVCDPSGALLTRCHPNGAVTGQADCPEELSCYRTNLLDDDGLCLPMPVCAIDHDCPLPDHGTCAATILAALLPDSSPLLAGAVHLDHLNCLHQSCQSELSVCASAEDCLGTNFAGPLADLCVPRCDSNVCPPDYACEVVFKNGQGEHLCVPSVPGARCTGGDCLAGTCTDTGAGFSVCTLPCVLGCSTFDTAQQAYVCVTGGGTQHCVTPASFSGANCESSPECNQDAGEFCAMVDPAGPIAGHGECRVPCKADGTCDPRGGLPHGCLFDGGGGCFPAVLGVACTPDTGCVEPMACVAIPGESDVPSMGASVCTAPCGVDGGSDVEGDGLCRGPAIGGYCAGGWCRPLRPDGRPCDRDVQCRVGRCDLTNGICPAN